MFYLERWPMGLGPEDLGICGRTKISKRKASAVVTLMRDYGATSKAQGSGYKVQGKKQLGTKNSFDRLRTSRD